MKLKITFDGVLYEVDVEVDDSEQPYPTYIPPTGQSSAPVSVAASETAATASAGSETVADESKVCRSPISGVVVRVQAQVGQAIQAHDVLTVLEAMKMETEITSPVDGKVAKVYAAVGDSVKGGQVLFEFE